MSNEPISEQYLRKAHEWADLDNAASLMEESKSSVLSQMILAEGQIPLNRAEANVKASERWVKYIKEMVGARAAANHARVELEYLRMRHREWVGEDANNRLQAKL